MLINIGKARMVRSTSPWKSLWIFLSRQDENRIFRAKILFEDIWKERLITSLGIKTIRRSQEKKKARYGIPNVSMMDIYKIIKEYEKFPNKGYVRKRSKNVPTDSYF